MSDESLEQATHRVHAAPHSHYIKDVEVGHHRLKLLAATVEVTCGIEHEHPGHPWTELDLAFPCPGIPNAAETRQRREAVRTVRGDTAHGLGAEVEDKWVLLGRMGEAKREDAGTTAYVEIESVSEDAKEWVVVHSESDERTHRLVDRLAGKAVRVTIEITGEDRLDREDGLQTIRSADPRRPPPM